MLLHTTKGDLLTGLQGYWSMDDLIDDTGNCDLTANNGPVQSAGHIGGSYLFDGLNDFMNCSSFASPNTITELFWLKDAVIGQEETLIHKDAFYTGAGNRDYWLFFDSGSMHLYIWTATGNDDIIANTSYPDDNSYHFIGFTYDGSIMTLYQDGVKVGSKTHAHPGNLLSSHLNLLFGRTNDNTATTRYYSGYFDEVGIWSRVLNSTEISFLYNGGLGRTYPFPSGPVLTLNTDLSNRTVLTTTDSFNFNGSLVNGNTDLFNCSVVLNNIVNQTQQFNLSNMNHFTLNFGEITKNFTVSLNCSNYEVSSNTDTYIFIVKSYNFETIQLRYLNTINANIVKIYEVLEMIPVVLLYAILLFLGYWAITSGNTISGWLLWLISIGFDFLFIGLLYDQYISRASLNTISGGFVYVFLAFMLIWLVGKISAFILLHKRVKLN